MIDEGMGTKVWVHMSLIKGALKVSSRDRNSQNNVKTTTNRVFSSEQEWDWVSAFIQRQITTQASMDTVTVLVTDPDSKFDGKTLLIPSGKINDENILMANTWSSDSELSNDSQFGTGFDESGNVTTQAKAKSSNWKISPSWRGPQNNVSQHSFKTDFALPPNDLIHLTHLHEPAVIYCLRKRYKVDEIYTSTGPILIALNPFKQCNVLYSKNVMQMYCERGERLAGIIHQPSRNGKSRLKAHNHKLPPHVYAVADDAYRDMMRILHDKRGMDSLTDSPDQSILVSGESGAGKTVTTKIIMRYLTTLSKRSTSIAMNYPQDLQSNTRQSSDEIDTSTEQQLLQSNPILESFGNARTVRNDNSSRFGKYIEIQFTENGFLSGASIDTYLLEKVRLVSQAPGERNYHIFYQILAGANRRERQIFFLDACTAEDFLVTSNSGIYNRRDGVKDDAMFLELKKAMNIIGFNAEEQYNIVSVVCAILHLSNITFVQIADEACDLDIDNPFLPAALSLLGVSPEALNGSLCLCGIEAGDEILYKTLNIDQSRKALEATIKAIYSALFAHIVNMVNSFISGVDDVKKAAFIGVLDIFGFEYFGKNSFEQLCINYCNEALQQQFNRFIFKSEQEEYNAEGISWSFISFPDNQDVIDLIEKKHSGILSILDEQCLLASCTDQSFILATYEKCSPHQRFFADRKQRASGYFSISHYAGPVEYDSRDFLEKNKDELPKEATELLYSSSIPFLHHLAQILETSTAPSSPRNSDSMNSNPYGRKKSSLIRVSVSGQFRIQLRTLRDRIQKTNPHYIRCLKPNDVLKPDQFDPGVIADQLKCGGILEAIRVSRVGFPQRYLHDHFVHRYSILGQKYHRFRKRNSPTSKRNDCQKLVDSIARQIQESKDLSRKVNYDFSTHEHKTDSPYKTRYGKKVPGKLNVSASWNNRGSSYLETGMQMGKSKVFLQRWAFDLIEQLLSTKKSRAVTLINSVVRMFLARCYFLRLVEEFYRENWAHFASEEHYDTSPTAYFEESYRVEPTNRPDTVGLIEKFERVTYSESRKRDQRFKWRMVDGRWKKH